MITLFLWLTVVNYLSEKSLRPELKFEINYTISGMVININHWMHVLCVVINHRHVFHMIAMGNVIIKWDLEFQNLYRVSIEMNGAQYFKNSFSVFPLLASSARCTPSHCTLLSFESPTGTSACFRTLTTRYRLNR